MKLYYFDASNPAMGIIPASTLTVDVSYDVIVNTGDIISINGEDEPFIPFTQNQKYLFNQSDPSNNGYRLTFPYYDFDSETWIDSNTGITPHGVPGRNGAYTYFISDTLASSRRYCLVKDGVRKSTLVAPIVTINNISFGVFSKAYNTFPFTVSFTSGLSDGSFNITDSNGAAVILTSPSATDLSYGTSSIDVTIANNVSSGVMTIGGTNGTTQTFDYVSIAQTFVVTIGNNVFLIDGASNVDLGLENGKSYMFDLSYSENYTFGLATDYDGANSSAYTNNITNVSNYMIVQNVSASSTLYYYETTGNADMGNKERIWRQIGGNIYGENENDYIGNSISLTSDGNTIAIGEERYYKSDYAGRARVFQYSNNSWSLKGSMFRSDTRDAYKVAISDDGNTVLMSGVSWPSNNLAKQKGSARVWTYTNNTWNQKTALYGATAYDRLGDGIGISANGDIVAISTSKENNSNGRIRVYNFDGSTLTQLGSTINGTNQLGSTLSLSSDGNVVAAICGGNKTALVYKWDGTSTWAQRGNAISSARDIASSSDGNIIAVSDAYDNSSQGKVRVYSWDDNNTDWTQLGNDIVGENTGDLFGYCLSLSSDGTILAVGAPYNDNNGTSTGNIRVFKFNQTSWVQAGDSINGNVVGELCGSSVSLSSDGLVVAVSSPNYDYTLRGYTNQNFGMVRIFEYK